MSRPAQLTCLLGLGLVTLGACTSEVDTCREQLEAVLAEFYAENPQELQVEHFASFDRLPQHDAPSCVTQVLHDKKIDADLAKRFELISPLWHAAVSDRNSALEPEIDAEGLIRASPSAEFYGQACERGFRAACARQKLAERVLACARGHKGFCFDAAGLVAELQHYPQAFASPVTLLAKGCMSGSTDACGQLSAHGKLRSLNVDFAALVCDRMPSEALCRHALSSTQHPELAGKKLCEPLGIGEFCPQPEAELQP